MSLVAPQPLAPEPQGTYTLKVGSLNVWAPGPKGREEALAGLMRQVDVVLLQEIFDGALLKELAIRADMTFFARVESVGIASRLPFSDFTPYWARRQPSLTPLNQLFKIRYAALCGVQLWYGGRRHHLFSNHWAHNNQRNRAWASEAAMRVLAALPKEEPVLFGGDFNAQAQAREVQALRTAADLVDSYTALPGSFHCDVPNRVDYLFTRGMTPVSYQARCFEQPAPTDHPFVKVELRGQAASAAVPVA